MSKFILIEMENSGAVIALPAEHAGIAAGLLAHAKTWGKDNYPRHANWVAGPELTMRFSDGCEFEPASEKLVEAQAALEKKSSEWYEQYRKAEKAEKALAETQTALAALQAVTVCMVVEPEPEAATDAEPAGDDSDA